MTPLSIYKQKARETLGGRIFSNEWIYALIVSLIFSLIISTSGTGALAIAVFIFTGPIAIGYCKYFLERSRRNIAHDNLGITLDGFRGDIGANVVAGILICVFTFLWSLLFIIPGIIKAYSYSMTYYIRCDHPEYTAEQSIKESQRIMQGNKIRLFCLHLSFIGWICVGILCFGVGLLWVSAYIKAAEAEFYNELVEFERTTENPSGTDIFNN